MGAAPDREVTAGGLAPADAAEPAVARALGRAAVYRLLGVLFAYPTAPRLEEAGAIATAAAPAATPAMGALLGVVADVTRESDPGTVADEHVFLFDGEARCPPYEGAYGPAQLAGKSALLADIAGFYAAFGLAPAATQPDLEDHIASELEFMSVLALKEAWALADGNGEGLEVTREAQIAFLTDHPGRWAEAFAADVLVATPLPYYTSAAALLAAWVQAEIALLAATPTRVGARAVDPGDAESFRCPMDSADPPVTEASS